MNKAQEVKKLMEEELAKQGLTNVRVEVKEVLEVYTIADEHRMLPEFHRKIVKAEFIVMDKMKGTPMDFHTRPE